MTVKELADLYAVSSDGMMIWDCESGKYVFAGSFDDVKISKYAEREVGSFEIDDGIIVFNI